MTLDELNFTLVNLYTKETPSHIYSTKTSDDVKVLYYTFDFQLLLEKRTFSPIYYHMDDIPRLSLAEPLLLQKALTNTAAILPGCIIEFADYLREKESSSCGISEKLLIQSISTRLHSLPDIEKVWCLTNPMRYGGALGFYQSPVLRDFCNRRGFSDILIGIGNRDYAYILKESQANQEQMRYLLEKIPDFMDNNGVLEETYLFAYNNETSQLTRIS